MNSEVVKWVLIISFSAYFIINWVFKKLNLTNLALALQVASGLRLLNLKHVLGVIFFGILPYVLLMNSRVLVLTIPVLNFPILLLFLFLMFLCVGVSWFAVRNNSEILHSHDVCLYRPSESVGYFIMRFLFLLCYEFFFRGVMFFFFLEHFSLYTAIVWSTFFYVLIHLFDGKRDIFGTIPFGVILCLFSFYTKSIWYSFVLHLALSAVYEITVFYRLTNKNKLLS